MTKPTRTKRFSGLTPAALAGPGRDLLAGGKGGDRIEARRQGVDIVRCGPGREVAIVGVKDRVNRSCEVVRRP